MTADGAPLGGAPSGGAGSDGPGVGGVGPGKAESRGAGTPDQPLPDVVGPGLAVLFCGINPGLLSAAKGQHFARPGNRFWPALHLSGFTPRLLKPAEQRELLDYGLGITNLVHRPTAKADELTADELRAGGARLTELATRYRPEVVAVVGIGAYRTAFGRKEARVGPQEESIAGSRLWVLPNPSGLNAHYRLADLAAVFGQLRSEVAQAG